MKKLSLAIAILSSSLLVPSVLALDSSATTQTPVYVIDDKVVLGRVENVYLDNVDVLEGIPFAGKIDTGADTTSMHAVNIRVTSEHEDYQSLENNELLAALVEKVEEDKELDYFDWNGEVFSPFKTTVMFNVYHPYSGEKVEISAPLERVGVIRSRTSSEPILRPTVKLPISIAGREVDTDINLTDRSQFSAPILIGKTFLENNAWVFAGYDYLQEQPTATVVGRKEQVEIEGLPLNVTFSLTNRYSNLHAEEIDIDKKEGLVTFDIETEDGKTKTLTRPLVRMLKVSGKQRPLVYVPVDLNDKHQEQWLVYLRDRSDSKTQLRVGRDTLSESFMVSTKDENLLKQKPKRFADEVKGKKPLVVSPKENVVIDGISLMAEPSVTVSTPLLKVTDFEVTKDGKKSFVEYHLPDANGNEQRIIKPVLKTLSVGDSSRPVVPVRVMLAGKEVELEIALEVLDSDEPTPYFVLGKATVKDGVYINTRADHLLDAEPLFKAGHIETVTVEGMTFAAKLDTGADVSSMSAVDIKLFEKDGIDMVSFTYQNSEGIEQELTKRVVDTMTIKAKKGEEANIRPVVEMHVKLGDLEKKVRVNLQDRSRFRYSMILGKNFLKHGAVVSSDENYLASEKLK